MQLELPHIITLGDREANDLLAFEEHRQMRKGPLREDYLKRLVPPETWFFDKPKVRIYDFSWGFIHEMTTRRGGAIWELHTHGHWQAIQAHTNPEMEARILCAFNELIDDERQSVTTFDGDAVDIAANDAKSHAAALVLRVHCPRCVAPARHWIATKMLPDFWSA